ncbi:uncharacterized protein LOC113326472 [Papaver somniferum]|uniref:uncharacterized protein LOC113326472 n=1 Tax=Papaver somniferum TaxID=3469 RepID=UPI000E703498|nr:uncharacterized protein LOC113326472 [Papaver somniferum]
MVGITAKKSMVVATTERRCKNHEAKKFVVKMDSPCLFTNLRSRLQNLRDCVWQRINSQGTVRLLTRSSAQHATSRLHETTSPRCGCETSTTETTNIHQMLLQSGNRKLDAEQ